MSYSTFFSRQAKKPSGLFGRFIMSKIFDKGNAKLNELAFEAISVQADDRILEIGFGTGNLIKEMAKKIEDGFIEGIDFSDSMISIARKRNKKMISQNKLKLLKGNFDERVYSKESFDKVCSVNTIYFWPEPEQTAKKIAEILKPDGRFVTAFVDAENLKQKQFDGEIFRLYGKDEIKSLLIENGFASVSVNSKKAGTSLFHCVVAKK